jgi:hypothetical protein
VALELNDSKPKPPSKSDAPSPSSPAGDLVVTTTLTNEDIETRLMEICKEDLVSSTRDVEVMLLYGLRTSLRKPWVFGVWLDKVPYLLMVTYLGSMPTGLALCRVQSTEYLLNLKNTTAFDGYLTEFFPGFAINRFLNDCKSTARRELGLSFRAYQSQKKRVTNKWLLAPYLSILSLCCVCGCFGTLTLKDYHVNEKHFMIQITHSTCVSVNNIMYFDSGNRGLLTQLENSVSS